MTNASKSIPIIDYNRRRENLSKQALLERGYDEKGWPFAPRVMNGFRANILAQMAAIVLLLIRAFDFIVRITSLFRKLRDTDDPKIRKKPSPPVIPKSLMNIIQRE